MAGVLHIGDADYESRNAADDDGVKKDFGNPRNPFIDGMGYKRTTMSKGSRPFPSFIGIHAAGNPVLHGFRNDIAASTASYGIKRPGLSKDFYKYMRQLLNIQEDDQHTDDDIKDGHSRNEVHGQISQTFQAAQSDA